MRAEQFDAVVVGAGGGGAPVAQVLGEAGMRVLVLERGSWFETGSGRAGDEVSWLLSGPTPRPEEDPLEFVDLDAPTPAPTWVRKWWTGNAVGGATLLWWGHMARYGPEDFTMASRFGDRPGLDGAELADWPVTFDELVPWYERVESALQVYGPQPGEPNGEPVREGYGYPNPPVLPLPVEVHVTPLLRNLGLHPYSTPSVMGGWGYDVRPIDPLTGRGIPHTDGLATRPTAANLFMRNAVHTGNVTVRTGAMAARVDTRAGRARSVVYLVRDRDGTVRSQEAAAPVVVVACTAIESARLFLMSGVPNPNDLIGRFLTFHHDCAGGGRLATARVPAEPGVTQERLGVLTFRDWYLVDDPAAPDVFKAGKVVMSDPWSTNSPIYQADRVPGWGPAWKDRMRAQRDHFNVHFSFRGEHLPQRRNRVELSTRRDPWGLPLARVSVGTHPHDRAMVQWVAAKLREVCRGLGVVEETLDIRPATGPAAGHGHQHGTLRMGDDPALSVLDRTCEAHEVAGLFVTDASPFPTSGGANTALTLMANALRVATHIATTGRRR